MKILISLLLALSLLFSVVSCKSKEDTQTVSQVESVSQESAFQQKADVVYEKPDQPLSAEKIASIPIANNGMSGQELRQICVDYMKLSVSCQWVADGTYYIWKKENPEMNFTQGKLYGGLPYIHKASGNLYRFMEYYDEKTGVFNSSALRENPSLFASACSGTTGWAWSRVVNSAKISWTHSLNAANGLVPVGPYTYDYDIAQFWELNENGEKVYKCNTLKVCERNGRQKMFQSYAQTHLADCYTRNGHVAMAVSEPVIVRYKNGKINGAESYIELAEQGQYTTSDYHLRTTADGTEYRIRGNDGRKFSFDKLYKQGFIVHTFKEFHGIDPVEAGAVTIETKTPTTTAKELSKGMFRANYPISDIFTTVYDSDNNEIYRYVYRTEYYFTKVLQMTKCIPTDDLLKYENGKNIVKIKAQLSNGEIVDVYEGLLVKAENN